MVASLGQSFAQFGRHNPASAVGWIAGDPDVH